MTYDILIIGGGINGCAIAREAALSGLTILLVEKDDLAQHTSSASTKLIHGGLRYLEHYEFALVREALRERERLLKTAPHLIRPLTLVLPHENAIRPWWLVRAGLLLYDRLGGRISLPRSRGLKTSDAAYNAPLKRPGKGFVYSDAAVDDARLTILNAVDAAENDAAICTRTALISARREDGVWRAALSDGRTITARALVNAAGPWVAETLGLLGVNARAGVRLIKGSHIVVPRLFEGEHAYMLQQPDRRVVFAIPWNGHTMIGTTDVPVERPGDAAISDDEIAYLIDAANRSFVKQIAAADIVSTWSGVRPLYDDGASAAKEVTRDYVLELDANGPPLLSVFGGKITTARHLAEEAMGKLSPFPVIPAKAGTQDRDASRVSASAATSGPLAPGLRRGDGNGERANKHPTRTRPLPGGDTGPFPAFIADMQTRWPFLGDARAERMARAYGSRLGVMLANVRCEADLGEHLGAGLTEIEVRWMRDREWARTPEDCLERRSKLGLTGDVDEARLAALLAEAR